MQKLALFMLCCLFLTAAQAQDISVYPTPDRISGEVVEARKSPMSTTHIKADDTYIRIVYSQPHLRGRQMLGNQVPYGKVWRLGANEATELFATKEFEVGGKEVNKGIYSLYTIPAQDKWTLIVNKKLGEWGAYGYDEKMDVVRVTAPVQVADKDYEAFSIWFDPDGTKLHMAWGRTWVSFPLELD